jgi:hypothetical protein
MLAVPHAIPKEANMSFDENDLHNEANKDPELIVPSQGPHEIDKYRTFAKDLGLTREDETEFLQNLFSIVKAIVDYNLPDELLGKIFPDWNNATPLDPVSIE